MRTYSKQSMHNINAVQYEIETESRQTPRQTVGSCRMLTFCLFQVPNLERTGHRASGNNFLGVTKAHSLYWASVTGQALRRRQQVRFKRMARETIPCPQESRPADIFARELT